MAIIPDVPHVVVDIVVDGNPLPEYLDEDDEDSVSATSITKYVECVAGSHFGIRLDLTGMEARHLERGNSITANYYLDGQKVASTVHRFPLGHHLVSVTHSSRHRQDEIWIERKFLFADLVTSEDPEFNKPRPELRDLGMITVKLHYACVEGSPFPSSASTNISAHENIHEKHLKGQAISQQAKLGEAVPTGVQYTIKARNLEQLAMFNFRYRSRKDLQTLYLIPRSPSPIPLEDRPKEDLTREELLELLRRQEAREEERIKIKQELMRGRNEDSDDDELDVVSSRPPAKQLKVSTDADTGIDSIDLSDD